MEWRRTTTLMGAAVLASRSVVLAQTPTGPKKPPPTADSLMAITERGRLLAQYDAAAWIASDSLMARRPDPSSLTGYVAQRTNGRWVVAFGRITAGRDTFFTVYEATQAKENPDRFDVIFITPPRADTGYYVRATRALDSAKKDFGQRDRPYNAAVLERADGSLYVYLMPAQVQNGVYPLGADARYHFSADGRTLVAKRQLHNALLEFTARGDSNHTLQAGTHTAILDDVPEDTDVFHVLVRQPRVPDYIVTDAFLYIIDPDGRIRLVGRREDVLGKKDSPIPARKP